LRFVYLHEEWRAEKPDTPDDVELICRHLNVDPMTLPNLFPLVDSQGLGYAHHLQLSEEDWSDEEVDEPDPRRVLRAEVSGTVAGLPYRALSHGEQQLVLIELAVALARYSAQYGPTMLILDGGMHCFGDVTLAKIMAALSDKQTQFQTLIVLPRDEATPVPGGAERTVARLRSQRGKRTTINQD
jgi:DNA repair exonuclease SbcCD ATPase subunit